MKASDVIFVCVRSHHQRRHVPLRIRLDFKTSNQTLLRLPIPICVNLINCFFQSI